jgi:hypothetical protein
MPWKTLSRNSLFAEADPNLYYRQKPKLPRIGSHLQLSYCIMRSPWPFLSFSGSIHFVFTCAAFLFYGAYLRITCSIRLLIVSAATMEYDKATSSNPLPSPKPNSSTTTDAPGRGHSRFKADSNVDTQLLSQPISFPFSSRTAPNQFLKVPMTKRLCHWSNENIRRRGVPSPDLINLYRRRGEGGIGVIVQGNAMVQYDAVEALGNPILCDDHDGRVEKYKGLVRVAKAHGSIFIAQLSHRDGRAARR